jgi:hypothetical protein
MVSIAFRLSQMATFASCGNLPADGYSVRARANSQPLFGKCGWPPSGTASSTSSGTATSTSSGPTSNPTGPIFVPGGGDFSLLGCFREPGVGQRSLPNVYADDAMTVELCLTTAAGFIFAGVEYGRECWYGNTLNTATTHVGNENCQFHCPGNENEYCGAGDHLVLYSNGATPPAPPTQPATVSGANFYGCVTDSIEARTLTADHLFDDGMTLEMCATFCGAYTYFGVE